MVKIIDAGVDQFGGEECAELLLDAVQQGRVSEERVDESARRLLLVKFRLGLFDDPFVDEDAAADIVGRDDFRDERYAGPGRVDGAAAQRHRQRSAVLPLRPGLRIYAESISPEEVAAHGVLVIGPRPPTSRWCG